MADHDDRDRPRNERGKEHRPPSKPPQLKLSGKPDEVKATVIVPGGKEGDKVTFAAGPEDNPVRAILIVDDKVKAFKVGADGVARGELDLSGGSADATHLVAICNGKHSEAVAFRTAGVKDGAAKKAASTKWTIRAIAPMYPDHDGDFFVPIDAATSEKASGRKFQAIADQSFEVLDVSKQLMPDRHNLEVPASGRGLFYFRFAPTLRRITIRLIPEDGPIDIIDLVR